MEYLSSYYFKDTGESVKVLSVDTKTNVVTILKDKARQTLDWANFIHQVTLASHNQVSKI